MSREEQLAKEKQKLQELIGEDYQIVHDSIVVRPTTPGYDEYYTFKIKKKVEQ